MGMIFLTTSERRERIALVSKMKLKNVVMGRGHDCGGLIAEIYMGRTKVADFHDDGWGGIPEVRYTSKELEKKFIDYISSSGVEEHIFKTDYRDFKRRDLGIHDLVEIITENIAVEMDFLDQIRKLQSKALVLEKDGDIYTAGLNTPISALKKNPMTVSSLRTLMRKKIKEGYTILNTNTPTLIM